MTHIALLTTSYPDGTPGSEAAGGFVKDFASHLATRTQVTVVAPALEQSTESSTPSLVVQKYSTPRLPLSLLSPKRPADWIPIITTLQSGKTAIEGVARRNKIDHILALWALPSGHWANLMLRRHNIPYSVWALGSDIWALGKIPLVRGRLKQVLRDAHRCYADGYQLGNEVESIGGRQCHFLPSTRNIRPPESSEPHSGPPYRLAFLGRWHPNKGIDVLLDSLSLLKDDDWQNISEVRIFGGGPLEQKVLDKVDNLSRSGRPVTSGGYLDKDGATELIAWADYLMLPSRIESIPVIYSDAAKVGTPLVATPVGDLPRLFENYRFGVVSESTTPQAFAGAIRVALSNRPELLCGNLEKARQDFSIPDIVERFLADAGIRDDR